MANVGGYGRQKFKEDEIEGLKEKILKVENVNHCFHPMRYLI